MRPPRRTTLLGICAISVGALVFAFLREPHDWLIYNHTPSIPRGLYLRVREPVALGAYVTVRAIDVAPEAAHARGFDDENDRFIKRVAATGGDHVCASGKTVLINHVRVAERRSHDRNGALLGAWDGCRVLEADEVFLLGGAPDSFDGRYWGPVRLSYIEGVWRRLTPIGAPMAEP